MKNQPISQSSKIKARHSSNLSASLCRLSFLQRRIHHRYQTQQDGAQLVQVLNDINKYFAKHPVRTVNGKNISFSFSGGLTKHLENEDFNATLARADSLVYKAKSLGRKQIIFA